VIELTVEDGVAKVDRLRLESHRIDVIGSGEIDISRDRFELRLTPKVRDPGIVSVAVSVDVHGSLADPQFRPRRRTLATSLAEGIARNAVRTGAALIHPFHRNTESGNDTACETRLAGLGSHLGSAR
jgi:hypothetical protein